MSPTKIQESAASRSPKSAAWRWLFVSMTVLAVAPMSTCATPSHNWHRVGDLWTASAYRTMRPSEPETSARRGAVSKPELPVAPHRVSFWPTLVDQRGSISVGLVTDGFIYQGSALPQTGPNLIATQDQLTRGTSYGSDEMIWLLVNASEALGREHPTVRMEVANIGAPGGGRIRWSISHRSGRDADILIPSLDANGAPLELGTMLHFNHRGNAKRQDGTAVKANIPATLSILLGLLDQDRIRIKKLFLSNGLRRMVLREAQKQGVEESLIEKMKLTIRQPSGGLPHDDHIHVRLGCSLNDVVHGCREFKEPASFKKIRARRIRRIARLIKKASVAERREAMTLLGWLSDKDNPTERLLVAGLRDRDESVRIAALKSLRGMGSDALLRQLVRRVNAKPSLQEIRAILAVLEHRFDRRWTKVLKILIADSRPLFEDQLASVRTIREEAIWLSGMTRDIHMIDDLLPLLDEKKFRQESHRALERITLLSPPQAENAPRIVWETLIPESKIAVKKAVHSRLSEIGLLRKDGRVRMRQCYSALRNSSDPVLVAAKQFLERAHSGRTYNPRWNRRDLLWHWRRKLKLR